MKEKIRDQQKNSSYSEILVKAILQVWIHKALYD